MAALQKKYPSVLFGRRSLPSVPAFVPGWDAFYLAIFLRTLSDAWRRMAHLNALAGGHAGVKASRPNLVWSVRYSARSSIAFSDTLLIIFACDCS